MDYLTNADAVLFSENWLDAEDGYKKYIDMSSFVDWYLVNEIAKNNDAIFYTSCYMNLKRGGKLKMGPLWDFDVAFGGYPWEPRASEISNLTTGFYIKGVSWINRMFNDPEFLSLVKERFNDFYSRKQDMLDHIDSKAAIIIEKVIEDNKLWGRITNKTASNEEVKVAYQEKVNQLKTWLSTRLEWLKTNLANL